MRNTEALYDRLGDTEAEIANIRADARDLGDKLSDLINEFCTKHDADYSAAMGYVTDLLSDLVFDASGPAERRKIALEEKIADIEDADLRRSAPVVL